MRCTFFATLLTVDFSIVAMFNTATASDSGRTEILDQVLWTKPIANTDLMLAARMIEVGTIQTRVLSPDGQEGLLGTSHPCFLHPIPTETSKEALWVANWDERTKLSKVFFKSNLFDPTPPLVVAEIELPAENCNQNIKIYRDSNSFAEHALEIIFEPSPGSDGGLHASVWRNRLVNGAFVSEQVVFGARRSFADHESFYEVQHPSVGPYRTVLNRFFYRRPETPEVVHQNVRSVMTRRDVLVWDDVIVALDEDVSVINRATGVPTALGSAARFSGCTEASKEGEQHLDRQCVKHGGEWETTTVTSNGIQIFAEQLGVTTTRGRFTYSRDTALLEFLPGNMGRPVSYYGTQEFLRDDLVSIQVLKEFGDYVILRFAYDRSDEYRVLVNVLHGFWGKVSRLDDLIISHFESGPSVALQSGYDEIGRGGKWTFLATSASLPISKQVSNRGAGQIISPTKFVFSARPGNTPLTVVDAASGTSLEIPMLNILSAEHAVRCNDDSFTVMVWNSQNKPQLRQYSTSGESIAGQWLGGILVSAKGNYLLEMDDSRIYRRPRCQ